MYSEIIILDEIRSAYLAIRVQSRFAHSSDLPNNRAPKGKAKKRTQKYFETKALSNLYQICCLGWEKPRFRYEYGCVKDSQCLNRYLLDLHGQKLRSLVFKILKVVAFKAKYCIPQYFRDKSALKNNIHRAKESSKIGEVPLLSENSVFIFSSIIRESRYYSLESSFRRFKV